MLLLAGCATPQYAVRPTPAPEESADALEIEREISAIQAREFEQQGARRLGWNERLAGMDVQGVVDRLSRVTERPALHYRAYLYADDDPNAAALADGRIYLSTGMVQYLAGRGSRVDELAFILAHELAHTVAQHLVKRYRRLQQQQLMIALAAAGAAAATRGASDAAQQAGRIAVDAVGLLQDVANSGYSQEQELEADQLGIRYVSRAGFAPRAALDLLQDFSRFDYPWPFMRTHPYTSVRRDYLERYLAETSSGIRYRPTHPANDRYLIPDVEAQRKALREAQRLYPRGSVSWQNLQRQLEALDR
ncbi:MAG: M48 family metalloprotease [Candidatus Omnitrophica bacterium]|nr:M48 family metalloprotease [Candidatus Omnitrophota bacterium]